MSASTHFAFERDIVEIEGQIARLRDMAARRGLDVRDEVRVLTAEARRPSRRDLPQPHRHGTGAGGPPSKTSLYPRLHRRHLHRLVRAEGRPALPQRRGHHRRVGPARRQVRHGDRAPEGPGHEGEPAPQLRHASPRGIPQGAAPHEDGREVRAARGDAHRHAGRVPGVRRRGAGPGRGDRHEPARDGPAAYADPVRGDRRGRFRRGAGPGGHRPDPAPRALHLFGHLARGVRGDPLAFGRTAGEGGQRAASDLVRPAGLGVADEVIAEPPGGAHADPPSTMAAVARAITRHLNELDARETGRLLTERWAKYEALGTWTEPGTGR